MTDPRKLNVDAAVTPKPKRDEWGNHDEPTEPTGGTNKLTWGRKPDEHFANAHAAGAALRALRRQRRASPSQREQAPPEEPSNPVGYCGGCGRYVVIDGWHNGPDCGHRATDVVDEPASINEYHESLREATKMAGSRARKPRIDVPPEWREPPGYPGYILHSVTRELWRQAEERTLKNGRKRRYPLRKVTARNGSYTMSVDGVTSSRGIQGLWASTFPEYAGKKRSRKKRGEWVDEVTFRHPERFDQGEAEWLAEDGARIITRPT